MVFKVTREAIKIIYFATYPNFSRLHYFKYTPHQIRHAVNILKVLPYLNIRKCRGKFVEPLDHIKLTASNI